MTRVFLAILIGGCFLWVGRAEQTAEGGHVFVPEVARQAAAEGNQAFEKADYKAARQAYRKVLELVPDNLIGLVNLGTVEFRDGNASEAERLLKQAVRIRLETAPAWLMLGILYYQSKRYEEALAALAQATLYDPKSARAHNFFGAVLGELGWRDGAEAELRKAIQLDPKYADAHYNLAVLYLERTPSAIELGRRHYFIARDYGVQRDPKLEKLLQREEK